MGPGVVCCHLPEAGSYTHFCPCTAPLPNHRLTRLLLVFFLSHVQAQRSWASWCLGGHLGDSNAVAMEAGSSPEEELSCAPSTQPFSPGRTSVLGSRNYSPQKTFNLSIGFCV